MKQALFEERFESRWLAFGKWLARHDAQLRQSIRKRSNESAGGAAAAESLHDEPESLRDALFPDAQFPERYRELCQHLALARDRQYSPELIDRLNQLALAGHHMLYGARSRFGAQIIEYIRSEFPRLVRREWRLLLFASVLLFGPLIVMSVLVPRMPQAAQFFMSPEQMAELRAMYADTAHIVHRQAESDVAAFGFYVWNNISIDFRTFASGLAFGIGTIVVLLFNGLYIGAVQGYLVSIGLGPNLWQFVAGHSALELIAAALSGVAGLRLGLAVIAPGARSRKQALVDAATRAIRVLYGAAVMTLMAAFIEAFWSSHQYIPIPGKYAVGIALWIIVILYFALAGRRRSAASARKRVPRMRSAHAT